MRSTRYQVPVCTWVLVFFYFFIYVFDYPLSVLFMFFFRKLRPYCRPERDIAYKHTAQDRAISSAQVALGIIKSLVASNHGPLLSALFACLVYILPCASEAGGVIRPWNGALAMIYNTAIRKGTHSTWVRAIFVNRKLKSDMVPVACDNRYLFR